MKKQHFYGLLWVTLFLYSCGSATKDELAGKKAELDKLKKEQQGISDKITALEQEISKLDTAAGKSKNVKLVSVSPIQTEAFSHFIELQGTVDAENSAYVAPPNGQGGIVKALFVKQGDAVRKGQLLARLDDQQIRQQIAPLKVQLETARDTYNRTKNLWDQGIGAYQNVLTAKTQVESLEKNIAIFENQISLMNVTAPTSGVADVVNVRVGEAFTGMSATGPQIRIVNTSSLKLVANVPENYLGRVTKGSQVEIVLPDDNDRTITANVNVVSSVIDPATRSFYIEAKVPGNSKVRPNQVAKVRIKDYGNKDAITIPVNTLQNDETSKFVLVAVKEKGGMVARKRTVTVGELYANKLEVKSGLQPGDVLITEGFQGLYDGQPITTEAK
ncbi:efflux RND transporter periplasmic adaptor subunit [Parasegetibacter sp. NRK P23]|uniref:efflux RND transporter periplasmic adaptor subunit n=1 Tax=Parasegetibacter sp. NRK P23 TaxID=2942999 RepID=UPI002044572B|nr:efflux RND transporter periplasmic adaptor subunit [Parasegetibacter sp. NRK P23]MCM5530556.1 efflux RND transporter periplasmic adaptor subunit [Parasegetibacter sp. NRK P23]